MEINQAARRPWEMKGHIKETMLLAGPVIVGQVGHMLIASADTIMIGDLGSLHLAAASIANGLFFLIAVIGIGICVVISPLTAQPKATCRNRGRLLDYVAVHVGHLGFGRGNSLDGATTRVRTSCAVLSENIVLVAAAHHAVSGSKTFFGWF